MIDPELARLIDEGVERTFATMRRYAPFTAERAERWANDLAVVGSAADYFKHVRGFPVLLIPRWLDASLGGAPDPSLDAQLIYSSINGYYFIRLVDNIMDGHATVEPSILPVGAFFHTESVGVFNPLFAADHRFWEDFRETWYASVEYTVRDLAMPDKSEADFRAIASRKVNAAKIPLLAVCHLRGRPDLIAPWSAWIDAFGVWHLFEEDLFDWHVDLRDGVRTYFLCEGERRKRPDESIDTWALREGVQWGIDTLRRWMNEVEMATAGLHSPAATAYLAARASEFERRAEKLMRSMTALGTVVAALSKS